MSTKVAESLDVDTHIASMSATTASSTISAGGSKVSKFGAKSGFVIPKNKLSGSLVPVFQGGKKLANNDTTTEENTSKGLRKTKWGPDLTQDTTVRKGRALAYQTRVDQITMLLKLGVKKVEDDEISQLSAQGVESMSSSVQDDCERLELLELEKREAIGEILKLNPSYKIPPDYKPVLKEAIIPIPIKQYQGYNFLGLIFGPASDTQKRLEKDTGTVIQVKGTKAETTEKVEVSSSDGNTQSAYDELYIHITADTYDKVDAAADLIELLVTSVSGNLSGLSTSTSVSGEHVNVPSQNQEATPSMQTAPRGVAPLIGSMPTPPQSQFQYPNPWFQSGPGQTPMRPLNPSMPFLTNPVPVQLASQNPPPLLGPRPPTASGFIATTQNPSLVPQSPQFPVQAPQHPYMPPPLNPSSHAGLPRNFPMPPLPPSPGQPILPLLPFTGSQPQQTGSIPSGRSVFPPLPQAVSTIAPTSVPDRPLTSGGSSSGWSGAPMGAQASLGFNQMGHSAPMMVPQGQWPALPQPGGSPSLPPLSGTASTGGGPTFASVPQVESFHGFHASFHPAPVQSSSSNSRGAINFSNINPPAAITPRPQHPSSVDFTFLPHRPQNPVPLTVPRPHSQPANLNTPPGRPMAPPAVPQGPSFQFSGPNQPVMPGYPRPQMGNQMGPSHAAPFGRNLNAGFANIGPISPATPISPMGMRNFGPGPQMPNPASPYPPRPGNPPQFRPNYPHHLNRPENHITHSQQFRNNSFMFDKQLPRPRAQIYDPFSPTSAPVRPQPQPQQQQGPNMSGGKQDNDPEYEDLMASVGVK